MQPDVPRTGQKTTAVCITGRQRSFAWVAPHIHSNLMALRPVSDVFISLSWYSDEESFAVPEQAAIFDPVNISLRPFSARTAALLYPQGDRATSHEFHMEKRGFEMAHTMMGCYGAIEEREARSVAQYRWVLRMRTDTVFGWAWRMSPAWLARADTDLVIYPRRDSVCRKVAAEWQPRCVDDRFAVMTRRAASAYFGGFYAYFRTGHYGSALRCTECRLGASLAVSNVSLFGHSALSALAIVRVHQLAGLEPFDRQRTHADALRPAAVLKRSAQLKRAGPAGTGIGTSCKGCAALQAVLSGSRSKRLSLDELLLDRAPCGRCDACTAVSRAHARCAASGGDSPSRAAFVAELRPPAMLLPMAQHAASPKSRELAPTRTTQATAHCQPNRAQDSGACSR